VPSDESRSAYFTGILISSHKYGKFARVIEGTGRLNKSCGACGQSLPAVKVRFPPHSPSSIKRCSKYAISMTLPLYCLLSWDARSPGLLKATS